jgi:hypothetical protein
MLRTELLLIGVLALGGCAGSGLPGTAPAAIATVQPGDDQLTCAQLTTQMGQMDQIVAANSGSSTSALTNTAASTASSATGGLSGIGQTLGSAASGVANAFTSNAAQQAGAQVTQAQQRKEHLMSLYTQKKC